MVFKEPRARKEPHGFFEAFHGEHPGDHNHQDFPKSTAIQMGGVPGIAIQMGGVLRYKWEEC